ncbi:MAG TPA: SDR family oxidoreductase [Anaerolineales bacterium]|nr:SDR family oxidoreductase [Anaerolineales bacterium]
MPNSDRSYQGKLALVAGGSMGLGLALARQLAEDGATVWILARHPEPLQAACGSLAASKGQRHGMYSADVTSLDQVQAAVEYIKRQVGVPDLLINCAGAAHPGYVEETPLDVFHGMMDLNYFGTAYMVKSWLPDMLKRGSGHIVNVSSMAGFLGAFGYSAYGAAKYAVRGFSDVLRLELKPLGIRVSVVFPPDMDTPGLANENKTKPFETFAAGSTKALKPEDVAQSTLRDLKRGRYIILPGSEPRLLYHAMLLIGNGVYPIMDRLVADARKKKQKAQAARNDGHI